MMSKHTLGPSHSIHAPGYFWPQLIAVLVEHEALQAYTHCEFVDISKDANVSIQKEK